MSNRIARWIEDEVRKLLPHVHPVAFYWADREAWVLSVATPRGERLGYVFEIGTDDEEFDFIRVNGTGAEEHIILPIRMDGDRFPWETLRTPDGWTIFEIMEREG